jgi:cysteinyl-tRNA synthetase
VSLSLYDSKSASLRVFEPIVAGKVGIYVCGPTVQSAPHVGHLRSAVAFDIIANWLRIGHGYDVKLVRNVTDVDDKILANAQEQGRDWRELAVEVEAIFNSVYDSIGAGVENRPHATDHIAGMISIIELLISRGHAYQAAGNANVFFDTASWSGYGELTRQKLENMDGEAIGGGRRAAHDFALWKAAKPGEPETAAWDSPWGQGRPGWHIECSAMTLAEFGEAFDIHGGGLDLRFPHHENELAQSRAAGYSFANYWMHNGLVTVGGQKMSKSLGNGVSVEEFFEQGSPAAVRYWLGSAHYRSTLDYSPSAIADAQAAVGRVQNLLAKHPDTDATELPADFAAAMDADFNVPAALAVLHDAVRSANSGDANSVGAVVAMARVLGIEPEVTEASPELAAKVEWLLEERNAARANKDFSRSDAIREELNQLGVTIEDTANGTTWSING